MPVSKELDNWIDGFERMDVTVRRAALAEWGDASRAMFDTSQALVHVITGNLKKSGRVDTLMLGRYEVAGVVSYLADYAIYEHARGDSHAWITRAWNASQTKYRNALARVWTEVEQSWNS